MKMFKYKNIIIGICILSAFLIVSILSKNEEYIEKESIVVNTNEINNKKIGWGIKRNKEHQQPDVGKLNKELLEKYEGICLGNKEKKEIVITFDEGYEAGYTPQILDTLKENEVTATFFLTAHYVNTNIDLVKRMIDEGHIVGNHIPFTLITLFKKYNKS